MREQKLGIFASFKNAHARAQFAEKVGIKEVGKIKVLCAEPERPVKLEVPILEEIFENKSEVITREVKSGTLKKRAKKKVGPKPVKINRTFIDK